MKITNEILKQSTNKIVTVIDRIPALIASIFSVLFALSIVLTLKDIVNGFTLVFLGLFIVLFVTMNEVVKVKMIKRVFNGNKGSLIPFAITFILSIGLSGIGIWYWTNKTDEIKQVSNINKVNEINVVKNKYADKILNLKNETFETTKEFESLNSELSFLKSRGTASIDERNKVRENIYKLQEQINVSRGTFNDNKLNQIELLNELMNNEMDVINVGYANNMQKTDRNNFISYIFLSLILITEFAIIILNKILSEKENKFNEILNSNFAQKYIIERNILISLYYLKDKNDIIDINKAKYSPANMNNVLLWEDLTVMYNMFISLGILESVEGEYKVLTNRIVVDREKAIKLFDEYYNTFLKIRLS